MQIKHIPYKINRPTVKAWSNPSFYKREEEKSDYNLKF